MPARTRHRRVFMDQKVWTYIVDVVRRTRRAGRGGLAELKPLIAFGRVRASSHISAQAAPRNAYCAATLAYRRALGRQSEAPDRIRTVLLTFEEEPEDVDTTADPKIRDGGGVP